jgi:3-oxoacyl-[acyl-carrier-protein] synthase II
MGVLHALGKTPDEYSANLFSGRCGIKKITKFNTEGFKCRIAAELLDIPDISLVPEEKKLFLSEISRMSLYCAQKALQMAGLPDTPVEPSRCGVIIGSGFTNLSGLEPTYKGYFNKGKSKVSPLTVPMHMNNAAACTVSMYLGFHGAIQSVSTACASGFTAIHDACRMLKLNEQDVVIAGGADVLVCDTISTCWEKLRILSSCNDEPEQAMRPFDKDKKGIVLGDGSVLFILERTEDAEKRGADILAYIDSVYQNADGYDMVKPSAESEEKCLNRLFKQSQFNAEDIDIIHAHGTGTALNDIAEWKALVNVFGERISSVPVCAIKSMTGHTMGASGPFALAAAVETFRTGYVYPQPNFISSDETISPCISHQGYKKDIINTILLNAFAFGGINASMIVSRN